MMTHQDRILERVIKQFDGISKIEAYDILQQIEIVLLNQSSPIQFENIQKSQLIEYEKKNIISVTESGYCYLEDQSHYINLYKFKFEFPVSFRGRDTYFVLRNGYKLRPLNKMRLIEAFMDTPIEHNINEFLIDTPATSQNTKTKRLLIMELLDTIDP